ncbi:ECF-type sigma factor [Cohnella cholangitidis]|uniref:Sigma-70 family RNA polymerase sigma factor n=1 Tax=Cohnella cholangitidis TaxID=2598458 RepID=A0A7G5C3E5_9BACL|nr:ECF-type sigma factor [Cohnella cholangitidis]QMV43729.1 sigma-70 family RNA polymerase sigma factor [Cohnella cholangitidis]
MGALKIKVEIEKEIIEQLKGYKRLCGRIKVLERQPVGMGYEVNAFDEDKLQTLHARLKGLPSYMYLNKREQHLETIAHAYLEQYPVGTKSQLQEIKSQHGADADDRKDLKELARRIQKVRDARLGTLRGIDAIHEKEAQLRDLMDERDMISNTLEALGDVNNNYSRLLLHRYIEGKSVDEVASILGIVRKTFDRWRVKAIEEYAILAGMS